MKRLIQSFKFAFRGLKQVLKQEQSFQIQLIIATIVLALAFYLNLRVLEKVALVLVIIIVLVLELINTIFERLSDILKPRLNDYIKDIKDILSAMVLIASLGAIIIGLLIFWPHIFK